MTLVLDIAAVVLASVGALLVLLASVGLLRLPDLLTRMHASSKAATLGVVCVFLAIAIRADDVSVIVRAVLICGFLFATAPVAAHAIARAGYRSGVPLSDETVIDELRESEGDR